MSKESSHDIFFQDLRFALRVFRKSPGFVAVAVLTLALGIGANSALFSVVNGVLLNPLPYPHSERLVSIYASNPYFKHSSISYPNFLDWRRENHSLVSAAAFRAESYNLTGVGQPQRLNADMVSATLFPLLGVKPLLGRLFTDQEDQLGGAPVALITEGLWRQKFAASSAVIGQSISLNNQPYTLVGVLPASFHFEHNNFDETAELFVPIGQWNDPLFRNRATGMGTNSIALLKPGVTLDQARSDLSTLATHLAETYPDTNKDSGITVWDLKADLVGNIRPFLLVLLAAVAFVLLIACANVANLLLARSTGRTREFAIRTALGANKTRIVRQLLTESVLLSCAGGALGLILAAWGTQAALKLLPEALPSAGSIHLDARVLLFTFAASLFAGILFGLVPAFKSSRTEIQTSLKEGGRGGSARHRAQSVFVALEMAFAVVLLIGAGLMIRTLSNLWHVNPGFNPDNVLYFGFATAKPLGATPAETFQKFQQLREAFASVPGVEAVSLTGGSIPLRGDSEMSFWLDNEPRPATSIQMKGSLIYLAQPDYLNVMKIPLKRGRFIQPSDVRTSSSVIVIDEEFAREYFGNDNPIGRHINFDLMSGSPEIVGVVGHIKQWGLDSDSQRPMQAQLYLPLSQVPDAFLSFIDRGTNVVVRTSREGIAPLSSFAQAAQSVNGEIVLFDMRSMHSIIARSLASQSFAMTLLGAFAVFAILLSALGIYGVISYVVGQRTQEIGIRMALGAKAGNVLLMVLTQAGRMALIGVAVGLLASLALTRLIATMLFGVNPYDPFTFLSVATVLLLVAIAACYLPARRASRVDPIIALRYE